MKLHKYSGAGNDFIVADGREKVACALCTARTLSDDAELFALRSADRIRSLCDRNNGFKAGDGSIGADGVMILCDSARYDFRMEFFNPDGTGGMMCGNGGRCIAAFAEFLGISPADGETYRFEAADGLHTARILSRDGNQCTVRLGMCDPGGIASVEIDGTEGCFLNTGTRHFVTFVNNVDDLDVAGAGARIRHNAEFAPEGTNVNFVERLEDGSLKIRTFEKGVEAETLACGTGCVAAAVAALLHGESADALPGGRLGFRLHTRTAELSVDFKPGSPASDVFLTGPAEKKD